MVLVGDTARSRHVVGKFINELVERLYLGDSTVLIGTHRLDNTRVAFEGLNRLRDRGCYAIEVDLLNVTSVEDLGNCILQKIQHYEREMLNTDLGNALLTAQQIAERDGKRMIIVFYEWQEVERIGGETLAKQLRSIMQHQNHITYLFVGNDPSRLKTMFASDRQPFYRFATILEIPNKLS